VAYSLGIYLLNLFLAFLQPKFDPSNEAIDNEMEDGAAGGLPTKQDEEFRPFIRRLPEFKFWYSATRAISIAFTCTWFSVFDVPVFWPVLVVYWLILFALTSMWILFSICNPLDVSLTGLVVRRQIQHMIKYRYVPFSFGKVKYNKSSS
jgi:Rer1 family